MQQLRRNLLTPPGQYGSKNSRPDATTPGEAKGSKTGGAAQKKIEAAAEIANLEMVGEKLKVYSLRNLLAAKRTFKVREATKLSDVLEPWFAKTIEAPGRKLGPLTDLWMQLVPGEIQEYCRIAGLQRSTLLIQVASAPARAHLETLLRQGLLKRLQIQSKGTIFRVKTTIDGNIVT